MIIYDNYHYLSTNVSAMKMMISFKNKTIESITHISRHNMAQLLETNGSMIYS